jgi:peptidoglycan/xylan/chitin deacetylase (PgdA/CDA1 family)
MIDSGKREIAAMFLGSRAARPFSFPSNSALRILAYHRVIDDDPASFLFDDGVISASPEEFYKQIAFAAKNFDVISFEDLYRAEIDGGTLPRRPMVITFDDGYRDNYTNAFPILREFGLPATIFLAAGHIGQHRLFWWDTVAYCIKRTAVSQVVVPEISNIPIHLGSQAEKLRAIEMILRWIKMAPDEAKNRLVERLPEALDVEMDLAAAGRMHLSWDEVREMSTHGIEFGSHTMTHPILSNVSATALETEIRESKRLIQTEIGKQVIAFAYPVGGKPHFNQHVEAAVARAGYRYAVSYVQGVAAFTRIAFKRHSSRTLVTERYSMPRIHVEADHSMTFFRANLMFPGVMLSGL